MTFDPEKPLEKIDTESTKANAALRDYYSLGAGRSLSKLHEAYTQRSLKNPLTDLPPTTKLWTINDWSRKHGWVARVEAQKIVQQREDERYWSERRREIREADDRDAQRLRDLAQKILDEGPNFIRQKRRMIRGENGQPDKEVITLALNATQATRALELASKLQRLSAEMADPAKKVEIEVKKEVDGILQTLEEKLPDDLYNQVISAIAGEEEKDDVL